LSGWCSCPATQRKVVVLPQPEWPQQDDDLSGGTAKLTPSMAGRPIGKLLAQVGASSAAVMISSVHGRVESLP